MPQVTATVRTLRSPRSSRRRPRALGTRHQLISRCIGGTTSRPRFGHHGANQPAQDVRTGKVVTTSQNHEFQVDEGSIPKDSGFLVSARNLNDGSVEGLAHRTLPIRTYQYHPEGAPGPKDNEPVLDLFLSEVKEAAARK